MSGPAPDGVAAALANWNGMPYIEKCLESLAAQTRSLSRVVVVDNGSRDGSDSWICRHRPDVTLLRNPVNRGFAAGYNQAIAASREPFVLVINTDVFLAPDFVERALPALQQLPQVGAVTGMVFQEGTGEWISGGFYLRRQVRIRHRREAEEAGEVFGCTGAVMLCRRAMLEDVCIDSQIFDEDYFSYGEDIDLAWRAQLRGWKAWFDPRVSARHVGSGSLDGRLRFLDKPAHFQRLALRNRYLTLLKDASPGLLRSILPVFLVCEPFAWLYLLARRPLRFRQLLLAYADLARLGRSAWRKRQLVQGRAVVPDSRIRALLRGV